MLVIVNSLWPSAYYNDRAKSYNALRIRIRDVAASRVRYEYRRLLQHEGWKVNRKTVYGIYNLKCLLLRHKKGKKRISLPRVASALANALNERWSMDFVTNRLADVHRFRVLTLVNHFSRVSPTLEAEFHFPGKQMVAVLDTVAAMQALLKELPLLVGVFEIGTCHQHELMGLFQF